MAVSVAHFHSTSLFNPKSTFTAAAGTRGCPCMQHQTATQKPPQIRSVGDTSAATGAAAVGVVAASTLPAS